MDPKEKLRSAIMHGWSRCAKIGLALRTQDYNAFETIMMEEIEAAGGYYDDGDFYIAPDEDDDGQD